MNTELVKSFDTPARNRPAQGIEQFIENQAQKIYGRQGLAVMEAKRDTELSKSSGERAMAGNENVNYWPSKMYQVDIDPLGKDRQKEKFKNRAFFIDPNYNMMNWAGGRLKPSSISFSTLRLMSYRCPQVRGIINTRVNQVSQIAWDIKLKDSNLKPNIIQQEKIDYLKRIIEYPVDNKTNKMGWRTFIKALAEDSLSIDATCIEKVPNRRGLIKELYPVDGSTIFPNMNEYGEYDPQSAFLQMIRGIKVAEFSRQEMVYGIRRPRTDVYAFGYGLSELETLIDIVTSILFVDKYNRSYFTNNSIPDGVLNLVGEMDPQDLEMWKRYWISEVKGIDNFWKMPILNTPEETKLQWINFKGTNREMQYNIYYDWLTRVACAVYQIDPSEINVHGQPGAGAQGHSGGTIAKIEYSKDKGLRDLVEFFGDMINDNVVDEMFPELKFVWTGIDEMTKPERIDIRTKQIQSGQKTINEFRKEDHEDPLPWGDKCGNPTIAMAYNQEQMMKQQQEQQQQQQGGMGGGMGQEQGPEQGQQGGQIPGEVGGHWQGQGGEAQEQQGGQGQEGYFPPEQEFANKTSKVKKLGAVDDRTAEKRKLVGTKASVIDNVQRRNIPPNTVMAKSMATEEMVDPSQVIRIKLEL